jgi:hypothetical protein
VPHRPSMSPHWNRQHYARKSVGRYVDGIRV